MNYLITAMIFAFCIVLPVGVGTIKMTINGLNYGATHCFLTGLGMNVVDIGMMLLYFFGFSHLFLIKAVEIVLWIAGIIVLAYLGTKCIKNSKIMFVLSEREDSVMQSKLKSFVDGIVIAFVPSNLIFWVATFGNILTKATVSGGTPAFVISCIGLLLGFIAHGLIWSWLCNFVMKLSNAKVIHWFNNFSGVFLYCFALYFLLQLIKLF